MNVGVIVDTNTFVTVRWQDGAMTQGMRSTDLVPVQHVLHADYWPEDFVVDKGGEWGEAQNRVGVVKRVIANARTCEVMWLPKEKEGEKKGEEEEKGNEKEEGVTEEVSMYALDSHPDFSYRLGCIVLRLGKDCSPSNTDSAEVFM